MTTATETIAISPVTVEDEKALKSSLSSILRTSWKYKHFVPVAMSTTLSHYVHGPAHPSWPLQISLFTSLVRHASDNKAPRDPTIPIDPIKEIQSFRKATNFEPWLPAPKNGLVVDVPGGVMVRKRGLGGLLKVLDEAEDGKRTLEAEWLVHNDVQAQRVDASPKVVLYFHGGGYTLMSKGSHRAITLLVSKAANCRVLSVNYRLAPETIFPGGLHDAVACYQYLNLDLKIPPKNIIVAGDSAGGGLSLAMMLYLRDMEMPRIGGAILISPWCDATSSLGSWDSNARTDYLTESNEPDQTMHPMNLYLGPNESIYRTHPYVSSCLASFTSLPPLLIQYGSSEVLRDEDTLLVLRAAKDGVEVEGEMFDGGIHVAQGFISTLLSKAAFASMALWANKQAQGTRCDWSEVDALLKVEEEKMAIKWGTKGKKTTAVVDKLAKEDHDLWKYSPVIHDVPPFVLRSHANPEIKKAVEELGDLTTANLKVIKFYKAQKNLDRASSGSLSRVIGGLHL